MAQYVFTMNRVGKIVPPKRQILKHISLSFFPGAKIGLLGLNGAGKSTVLRIMAGVDKDYAGESRPQPGIKIGYLEQEPRLNPEHTVRQAVEEGVGVLPDRRLVHAATPVADRGDDERRDQDQVAHHQGEASDGGQDRGQHEDGRGGDCGGGEGCGGHERNLAGQFQAALKPAATSDEGLERGRSAALGAGPRAHLDGAQEGHADQEGGAGGQCDRHGG